MNRSTAEGRLGIGLIGAGSVGPVLALALAGAGHAIVGVSAISEESKERAESLLPGVPILETSEVVRRSELVIFAMRARINATTMRLSTPLHCSSTGAITGPKAKPRPIHTPFQMPDPSAV